MQNPRLLLYIRTIYIQILPTFQIPQQLNWIWNQGFQIQIPTRIIWSWCPNTIIIASSERMRSNKTFSSWHLFLSTTSYYLHIPNKWVLGLVDTWEFVQNPELNHFWMKMKEGDRTTTSPSQYCRACSAWRTILVSAYSWLLWSVSSCCTCETVRDVHLFSEDRKIFLFLTMFMILLHAPIKRNKFKSFKNLCEATTIKKNNSSKTVEVNRDILGSLLSFSSKSG